MKRKGFTLIELLAVIVVLAIIALIATPMVLNTIEESRKGASIESVNGIISAAETEYMSSMLTGKTTTRFDFPGDTNLDYKGTKPESGTLVIDKNGNVSVTAKINGYCIRKRFTDAKPEVIDTEDCTIEDSELEEATNYKESILNGADPVISGNLIPVNIASDGTVTKANRKQEWYSYENKSWANAVVLFGEDTYSEGDTIAEEAIESYFVWIPRYKYQLFYSENYTEFIEGEPTDSTVQPINIVFESKNTTVSDGTANGEWLTHPAFTSFDTAGLWVGKYETGYNGATSKEEAQIDSDDFSKIIVKPNVYSWRGSTVSNIFTSAFNYKKNLGSHMMKNMEWGAVAYLSHSKYGINNEVNINNNSNYLTGYSAVDTTDQSDIPGISGTTSDITLPYNTETGYKASTTGNISGIYDMSGGTNEYMAAYMKTQLGNSGFTSESIGEYDAKYFDVYENITEYLQFSKGKLGDATKEIGPFYYYQDGDKNSRTHSTWYKDYSYFICQNSDKGYNYYWFFRGGNFSNGALSGQFYMDGKNGASNNDLGSRLVLAFN